MAFRRAHTQRIKTLLTGLHQWLSEKQKTKLEGAVLATFGLDDSAEETLEQEKAPNKSSHRADVLVYSPLRQLYINTNTPGGGRGGGAGVTAYGKAAQRTSHSKLSPLAAADDDEAEMGAVVEAIKMLIKGTGDESALKSAIDKLVSKKAAAAHAATGVALLRLC
jgi:hypothetical protein